MGIFPFSPCTHTRTHVCVPLAQVVLYEAVVAREAQARVDMAAEDKRSQLAQVRVCVCLSVCLSVRGFVQDALLLKESLAKNLLTRDKREVRAPLLLLSPPHLLSSSSSPSLPCLPWLLFPLPFFVFAPPFSH